MGRLKSVAVVDHKHPVADGGEMWDRENWWSLCRACHDWKASLEAWARKNDEVGKLRFWCDNPSELPMKFRRDRM